MATVFRATDRVTGEIVAVKVLSEQTEDDVARFQRESAILADLQHPGIVRYIAHGKTPRGAPFLAMEWLEGETLDQRLLRVKLSVRECARLILRVAGALAVSHARQIVHRDLKPNNLFLPNDAIDRVKVLDFGIAQRRGVDKVHLTLAGTVIGTPAYMAPERARGRRDVDSRADIFSLGCVLFECLAGIPAFPGDDPMAILAKVLLEDPPKIRELRPEVPTVLEEIVSHMLAKEPALRIPDASALEKKLQEIEPLLETAKFAYRDPSPRIAAGTDATRRLPLPSPALTGSEQRVVCLVFVGRGSPMGPGTISFPSPLNEPREVDVTARETGLARVISNFAGRLDMLAGGAKVVSLSGTGAANDQAIAAARCALAMAPFVGDEPMALVTGRAVLSSRMPLGEIIDRGVRALRKAQHGHIGIDDVTAGLLSSRFQVTTEENGLSLGRELDIEQGPRTVLGKTTTLVGRDRELSQLEGLFAECTAEPVARAVLVTGSVGVGKSRLRQEFLRRLSERDGAPVALLGWGEPLSAGSPFSGIAPVVRRAAGILDGEPSEVQQQKLKLRLKKTLSGKALDRSCEFLAELIHAPMADNPSDALYAARQDPRLMGDAMRAAWVDWIEAECDAQPTVLVFEDFQWGDLPSVKFIDAALRSCRDKPLMVLALGRPEVRDLFPGLWEERDLQEIRLSTLTKKASEKLVRQVLGTEAPLATVTQLIERAEGNPFYLEELIRAVGSHSSEVPESVLGVVQARLDALGQEAKRVLRAASIFGQMFWRGGALELLGQTNTSQIAEWLEELVEREVIFEQGPNTFPGEREYVFRHSLLRDAAYAMLTDSDRVLGHRLAGQWLERAGERQPLTLAEHFERGGEQARASVCFGRGAMQALEGNDFTAAVIQAERAVKCGAKGETLAQLRMVQAQAHFWRGEFKDAERRGVEAAEHCKEGSALWFQSVGETLATIGHQGEYERVEVWVRKAMQAVPESQAASAQATCLSRAAGYLTDAGRYQVAGELLERLDRDFPQLEPAVAARAHFARFKSAIHTGDFGAVLAAVEATLVALAQVDDARSICEQRINLGYTYNELGDFTRAEQALTEALQVAERMGLENLRASALLNLGCVLTHLRRLPEARAAELQAAELFRSQGDLRLEGGSRMYLSTISLHAGDFDEAESAAREAVGALEPVPPLKASALAALARALLAQDRTIDALVCATEGMALLEKLGGIEEYEALLRRIHAEALYASGRVTEAHHQMLSACNRLIERAAKITDPSLRSSFLTNVGDNRETLLRARDWGVLDPQQFNL